MDDLPLTVALLAGGRGARLGGRLKPLAARPDGRTLLAAQIEALRPHAAAVQVVLPADLEPRFAAHVPPGIRLVHDPGQGPGPAVAAAAAAAETPWLLVVGGDHVRPSPSLLEVLWRSRGADGAVVRADDRLQGTHALLRTEAVRGVSPVPASLYRLLRSLSLGVIEAEALPPEARAGLEDVDTPEGVARHGLTLPEP